MVALKINLADIGGRPVSSTRAVFLSAPAHRPSVSVDGRVITTTPYPVDIVAGLATVTVEPGELVVEIRGGLADSRPKRISVPSGVEEVTLQDLLESAYVYEPPVVSLVKQYLDATKAARDTAVAAADSVGSIADDVAQIAEDRAAAELARNEARDSAEDASESRGLAAVSAVSAGDSSTLAGQHETAAAGHASNASSSATAADQSESAAAQHEVNAETAADLAVQTAAGIQDVAADAAQVAADRQAVESAASTVAADRQTVTDARGVVVAAKGDVEQVKIDVHQVKSSIENTASLVDQTLEQYGTQFVAERELSQQAVTDATAQAQRAEDAAEGIVAGSVLDNAVTTPKLADEAVTKAKTSPTVQASLDKADGAVQEGDTRLTNARTPTAHSHAVADVTGLQGALDGKAPASHTHSESQVTGLTAKLAALQPLSEKGQANGYAPLDATGKLAAAYQPSYVDDVLEYANLAAFPSTGETGKIYTSLANNRIYRWSGSTYIEIAPSPGSTDVVPEGATNKYFTDARALAAAKAGLQVPYPVALAATLGTRKPGMTELATGTGPLADAVTFSKMILTFETADASGDTVVQILKNGGVVAGMALTCSAAAQAGAIAGRTATGAWSFAAGDVLTVQIVSVGNTPGKGLTVSLAGKAGISA